MGGKIDEKQFYDSKMWEKWGKAAFPLMLPEYTGNVREWLIQGVVNSGPLLISFSYKISLYG